MKRLLTVAVTVGLIMTGCGKKDKEEVRNMGPQEPQTVKTASGREVVRRSASGVMSKEERKKIEEKAMVTLTGTIKNITENIDLNISPGGRLALIKDDGEMVFMLPWSYNEVLKLQGKRVMVTGRIASRYIDYNGKDIKLLVVKDPANLKKIN